MSARLDPYFERDGWREEARALRRILLGCGLGEELKWRQPCYTHGGRNIAIIGKMKDAISLGFFRGALLTDPDGLLEAPGENSRFARRIRFTSTAAIEAVAPSIEAFVREAVAAAEAGTKVPHSDAIELVEELAAALAADPALKAAFEALTPGRQRGYNIHIKGAKQARTRVARIDKCRARILAGKGFHDR